jgi:small subunit ribosomal protein S20
MPNTASTKKRVRQTDARTLRNKQRRSAMRTCVRKVREAVAEGNKSEAQTLLKTAYKEIDKAAKQHILHANTAANKKRKLAKLVESI